MLSNSLKDMLFPTFIAITYNNERNLSILSQEIDTRLISEYIKQWLHKKEDDPAADNLSVSSTSSAFNMLLGHSPFVAFYKRFPKTLWEAAILQYAPTPTAAK